jgi:hypothetical protein
MAALGEVWRGAVMTAILFRDGKQVDARKYPGGVVIELIYATKTGYFNERFRATSFDGNSVTFESANFKKAPKDVHLHWGTQ